MSALFRIRALHRRLHPVRVVSFLNKSVCLYADTPSTGMIFGNVVIGFDPGRDAVLDLDLHQIRSRHTLITVYRNLFPVLDLGCHATA